ncbi:MAG TPA: glycoside hydrolase family 99-like domain-containing protein, partial [Acetobacteraceae bacterium]
MRAHRVLCSPFVNEDLFRRSLGGGRADLGTVARYLNFPLRERPLLSYYFDPYFYLATNPDIVETGLDPFLHFIETGLGELRAPHPLVDPQFITGQDAHVLGNPVRVEALMDLLEYDLASPSAYFDPQYYQDRLGPNAPSHGMLRHFLSQGLWSRRPPNHYLDPLWYADQHADAPRDPYGAMRHFIMIGDPEGRPASPEFDGRAYWARYTDVAEARIAPLRHFLTQGRLEGRQATLQGRAAPVRAPGSVEVGQPLPVDPQAAQRAYAELRGRVAAMRQHQKDNLRPVAPPMIRSVSPLDDIEGMGFPPAPRPRLSILIPVFNELDVTVECLLSLLTHPPAIEFEVVIADDCSTDPGVARLGQVPNLVHRRQSENAGFIRNCNAAFAVCRGEYVLLLNNDTQVMPGAIDRMAAALDADPGIGAVGPKLIYPDGRVQEAGCFLKPNGESGMVGLFRGADEGGFCYDRDVMYCSGAALMLRRALAGPVLFDEAYRPAYCEDADLCLRLTSAGHRVRYVHEAVVMHHLSVSSNRQSVTRKLRTITRNQQKLVERWSETLRRQDRIRTLAFYLPQFHPTPENDLWWGQGFTEWTNVSKAQPSYAGHYQPHLPGDLGFYDLRLAETLRRQAELATRYGIEGFCVYYYNFGKRRVLSRPLEVVRANPDIPFRWCLCWANENWTKHWDGGSREILLEQSYDSATLDSIIADAVVQAADPRYLRVNGKPLFLLYRPLLLPDAKAFARACRAAFAQAGFPGVHLVYVESMEAVDLGIRPADLGFDASVEFPPQGRAVPAEDPVEVVKPGWSGYRYDYAETVLAFIRRDSVPYPRYPAVFPSWDNTPRQPLRATSFDGISPEAFRVYVEEKIEELRQFTVGEERLLFVNAWNEWAEGAHLEPDSGYGHRWLEALRDG